METIHLIKQILKDKEQGIEKRLKFLGGQLAFAGEEVLEDGGLGLQLTQRDLNNSLKAEIERKLGEVRLCLQRIDEGTYGSCISCGQQIGAARLQVIPTATECLDCKNNE